MSYDYDKYRKIENNIHIDYYRRDIDILNFRINRAERIRKDLKIKSRSFENFMILDTKQKENTEDWEKQIIKLEEKALEII